MGGSIYLCGGAAAFPNYAAAVALAGGRLAARLEDAGGLLLPGGGDLMVGSFINAILNFLIMAFVVFCLVKGLNAFHRKKEAADPAAPPAPSKEELLLTEIRDLLKEQKENRNG